MVNHPNRSVQNDGVTPQMVTAAINAEFRHYYKSGTKAERDWKGTDKRISRKMIAAALAADAGRVVLEATAPQAPATEQE